NGLPRLETESRARRCNCSEVWDRYTLWTRGTDTVCVLRQTSLEADFERRPWTIQAPRKRPERPSGIRRLGDYALITAGAVLNVDGLRLVHPHGTHPMIPV